MIPKHLLIDFDKLKVGQTLWTIQGVGTISCFRPENEKYVIRVMHENGSCDYTKDGKVFDDDILPSAFLSNPFDLISEYPKEMMVSDDTIRFYKKLIVWEDKEDKRLPYLDDDGKYWSYAKDIEPGPPTIELTMEEILEKVSKIEGKTVIVKP